MSFDWSTYLEVAQELASGGTEAKRRSSISRAYYSAFCTAREWLAEHDSAFHPPKTGDSHKAIWDRFNEGPERQKLQVAKEGSKLKFSRTEADYNGKYAGCNDDRTAQAELLRARTVLKLLRELAEASARRGT